MYHWDTKIRYVRGLGPTRSQELIKIGITTVGELLERQPLSYIFPGVTSIKSAKEGMVVIRAKIHHIARGCGSTVIGVLEDETGACKVIWYCGAWAIQSLRPGWIATFWGKMKDGTLQNPKWTTSPNSIQNVYGGQYGEVHHQTIRATLVEVLANVELPDLYTGWNRVDAFKRFHFPCDKAEQQRAEYDLKMDEAICLQTALAGRRKRREGETADSMPYNEFDIQRYFPYDFTCDQQTATRAIVRDLASTTPMQRLIHGEVGSGKTAVAFYAAMLAALNGKQTLILCPTTILAQQHYDTLKGMGWNDVGLQRTGETFRPNTHIVIGTHNLLNLDYLIAEVSLVIIDEQQKFGVEQRAQVTKYHPHLLLMSATPIPRSLAATVFGDLDVSTIKELPIKRGTVITKQVLPEKQDAMWDIVERELVKGHQAYFVYPRINGDEDEVNATDGFCDLYDRFDGRYNLALLTGKHPADRKTTILRQFHDGHTHILVSTIIAEVGLDVPNATVMVIEGADRFGLSQLHQLRGRICRSVDTAFCFLVSETSNPTSIARLEVIERCNDGFLIAEHDLRLRGAGEVFSTRQTGLPDLKWCSLVDDFDLMIKARETVNAGSVGEGPRAMMELKCGNSLSLRNVS